MGDADRAAKFESFNAWSHRAGWPLRADATLAFDTPILRDAFAVWKAKAGDRRWPARSEMTPRAMKSFLAEAAVLDVIYEPAGPRYRVRVMGSRLDETFSNATGKFIDEFVPATLLPKWLAGFALVLDVGGPARMTDRIQFRDREYLQSEELLAPLGNPDEPPHALLCIVNIRPVGEIAVATPQTASEYGNMNHIPRPSSR
jgi:hypothetical protein